MLYFSGTDYKVTLAKDLVNAKKGTFVIVSKNFSLIPQKPTIEEIKSNFLKAHGVKLENVTLSDFDIEKILLIR